MEMNNELLAAYAEGKVLHDERKAVRQYLTENPEELESVMMMMDEDYELAVEDEDEVTSLNDSMFMAAKEAHPDLCYSAAAFVSPVGLIAGRAFGSIISHLKRPEHSDKGSFDQRLGDLLNDLDL